MTGVQTCALPILIAVAPSLEVLVGGWGSHLAPPVGLLGLGSRGPTRPSWVGTPSTPTAAWVSRVGLLAITVLRPCACCPGPWPCPCSGRGHPCSGGQRVTLIALPGGVGWVRAGARVGVREGVVGLRVVRVGVLGRRVLAVALQAGQFVGLLLRVAGGLVAVETASLPEGLHGSGRSEERRVGKECLRLCRSRWSPYH